MEKKNYIDFFLFTEKAFFTENEKKYISSEKYFLIQKIYIHSAKKIFFDHKKYIC